MSWDALARGKQEKSQVTERCEDHHKLRLQLCSFRRGQKARNVSIIEKTSNLARTSKAKPNARKESGRGYVGIAGTVL